MHPRLTRFLGRAAPILAGPEVEPAPTSEYGEPIHVARMDRGGRYRGRIPSAWLRMLQDASGQERTGMPVHVRIQACDDARGSVPFVDEDMDG